MSGYLLSILGFFLFSTILVSGTVGFIFRTEIKQAIDALKVQTQLTKSKQFLNTDEYIQFKENTNNQKIKPNNTHVLEFIKNYTTAINDSAIFDTKNQKTNEIKTNNKINLLQSFIHQPNIMQQNTAKKMPALSCYFEISA